MFSRRRPEGAHGGTGSPMRRFASFFVKKDARIFRRKCKRPGGSGWVRTTVVVRQQIYSLPPLATWVRSPIFFRRNGGAGGRIRTPDLLITNQLLYRLSYTSISATGMIISQKNRFVNIFPSKKSGAPPRLFSAPRRRLQKNASIKSLLYRKKYDNIRKIYRGGTALVLFESI